jgi:response regulator NasT
MLVHRGTGPLASDGSLTGKRIVIVEDEGVIAMMLSRSLTAAGLLVVGAAPNPTHGMPVILRQRPDIVLMDIEMSDAQDGLEAAEKLLKDLDVCVILVSALSLEHYVERATSIGAAGYIAKPVDSLTLMPILEATYAHYRETRDARKSARQES